jgi:hypothetical protein
MTHRANRQLTIFVDKVPTWESLPQERQDEVRKVLSLLLEQALQHPSGKIQQPPHQNTETADV